MEISKFEKDISYKKSKIDIESKINEQFSSIERLRIKLENKLSETNKHISFYAENDTCPTCDQLLPDDKKNEEISTKTKLKEEIENGILKVKEKIKKIEDEQFNIDNIKADIQLIQNEINQRSSRINALTNYINDIKNEINSLKKPRANIENEKALLKKLKCDVSILEEEKESLIMKRSLYDVASIILKDSGVKALIIKQYLPLINKYTNIFLSSMDFFASFYINSNFQEYIKSRGCDDFSYGNFSEGEKQRIDLALLFTWRTIAKMKNSVNTNLLVMDEILDSYLDVEATENVLELLRSQLFNGINIFVISHKRTISDKFDSKIEFTKVKNFSKRI